jgi:hypothetical protein
MRFTPEAILAVLDQCCNSFTFPMLDNGYVYLAGTRLSLHRSVTDWALVIEVFGFSPRAGLPVTCIQTFASRVHNRKPPERYVNRQAYEKYLSNNPHNESHFIYPIREGPWQDVENSELVAENANEVIVREQSISLPPPGEYARHGIELEKAPRIQVFELCRFLAGIAREQVLATPLERCVSLLPDLEQILQLEEWHHPDVADSSARPSGSETFQQLAQVLVTGDVSHYRPSLPPNTHWGNWPDGGRL